MKRAACQFFIFLGSKVASQLPGDGEQCGAVGCGLGWMGRRVGGLLKVTFAQCVCEKNSREKRERKGGRAKKEIEKERKKVRKSCVGSAKWPPPFWGNGKSPLGEYSVCKSIDLHAVITMISVPLSFPFCLLSLEFSSGITRTPTAPSLPVSLPVWKSSVRK